MARPSITIAQVMTLTALVAVDLAMIPFELWFLLKLPFFFFLFVSLNLVIVQAFLVGRPLGPFHYTFVVAGAIASIAMNWLMLLATPFGSGESWQACLLTLLVAWGSARLASRLVGRRIPQPGTRVRTTAGLIAQGALIGFGLFVIGSTLLFSFGLGPDEWHPERVQAFQAGLLASPFLGAIAVWTSVRWSRRAPQTSETSAAPEDPLELA